jgi:BirA family biotin operon repressor/biotin-[acetyl-CoA-carboxylase] ligase
MWHEAFFAHAAAHAPRGVQLEEAWPAGREISMGALRVRLVGPLGSTQEEVWTKRRWMEHGAGVAAPSQHAGVGRGASTWDSPEGGVYVSFLVGAGLPAGDADALGYAAALAALRTAQEVVSAGRFFLKWPNDLVVEAPRRAIGKVAGVVARTQIAGDRIEHAAVGVGINVADVLDEARSSSGTQVPASLEECAGWRKAEWNATPLKVLEWFTGWFALQLERVRADAGQVRDEFSREVARAPLYARVPGVREDFRPLGVARGGALRVRRANGKAAEVSVEDAGRLEWRLKAAPAAAKPQRAAPKRKPAVKKRKPAAKKPTAARPKRKGASGARPSGRR